jgi:PIN domain nuclease of toxin-antitoxin system
MIRLSFSPVDITSIIAADTTELWLSPISVWEVLLLAEKGRISLQSDPNIWIDRSLKLLAICEAPLNHQVVLLKLIYSSSDGFD